MEIRRYQDSDNIEETVRKAVESVEPENYSESEQNHLENVIPEMSKRFVEKDRYVYFVAVQDGKILGVAGLQKESGVISGLFVDPEVRGEGIGSRILEVIEEKAREEGLDEIESPASLEAVEFYRKNGYRIVGKEERDMDGRDIAVKVMIKHL